jgi:hypothetical protein
MSEESDSRLLGVEWDQLLQVRLVLSVERDARISELRVGAPASARLQESQTIPLPVHTNSTYFHTHNSISLFFASYSL